MHNYTITFQRADGTQFDFVQEGYDFQHAYDYAQIALSNRGETGAIAVAYVRAR